MKKFLEELISDLWYYLMAGLGIITVVNTVDQYRVKRKQDYDY